MKRAERVIRDCPYCSAGDEPVEGSEHAAALAAVRQEREEQRQLEERLFEALEEEMTR